jgi:magnesium-transporting ATPase (P-type)
VTLSIALAFEPGESDIMARPPRRPGSPILTRFMVWRILFVSALMVGAAFGLFALEAARGADVETARTVAVNTLVATQAAYLLNVRLLTGSTLSRAVLFGNRFIWLGIGVVLLLQLLFTYAPFMHVLFDTRPLPPEAWVRVLAVSVALYAIVEMEKLIFRRFKGAAAEKRV